MQINEISFSPKLVRFKRTWSAGGLLIVSNQSLVVFTCSLSQLLYQRIECSLKHSTLIWTTRSNPITPVCSTVAPFLVNRFTFAYSTETNIKGQLVTQCCLANTVYFSSLHLLNFTFATAANNFNCPRVFFAKSADFFTSCQLLYIPPDHLSTFLVPKFI